MNQIIIGGRYKVLQKLSEGGFGETFIAEGVNNPNNSQLFVVKKLKPQNTDMQAIQLARRLFTQETQVLYHLGQHRQIPTLVDKIEENGEFYLVQEYIEGNTLQQELDAGKTYDEAEVLDLLEQLLEVLAFVHRQNVIHRDIKPSNIIRRKSDGKIVLIDFGAVKQVRNKISVDENGFSTATVAIGSNGYMANEQMAGHPRYSSDIYSIGMLVIQLLTKIHPFRLKQNQESGEWVWMNHAMVRVEFAEIIKKMIYYDYRQRFETAITALNEIKKLKLYYSGVKGEGWKYKDLRDSNVDIGQTQVTFSEPIPPKEKELNVTQQYVSPQTKVEPIQPKSSYIRQKTPPHYNGANDRKILTPLNQNSENLTLSGTDVSGYRIFLYGFLIAILIPTTIIVADYNSLFTKQHEAKLQKKATFISGETKIVNTPKVKLKKATRTSKNSGKAYKPLPFVNKPIEKNSKKKVVTTSHKPTNRNPSTNRTPYPTHRVQSKNPWQSFEGAKEYQQKTIRKEGYAKTARDWSEIAANWHSSHKHFLSVSSDHPKFSDARREQKYSLSKHKAANAIVKRLQNENKKKKGRKDIEEYLNLGSEKN